MIDSAPSLPITSAPSMGQQDGDSKKEHGRSCPFYIMAPAYDERSAGNRVLHALAEILVELGYEAFIAGGGHDHASMPTQRRAGILDSALARSHHADGRTPIVIYPETAFELAEGGVRVLYLLNYPGIMGGPTTLPGCDAIIAYSADIARELASVNSVLFIPVSDPEYWVPAPDVQRCLSIVYAGKFVDHHRGTLPHDVDGFLRITRHHQTAATRDEIRFLLQRARCFHVFENTALAAEAALCGCPVVLHQNSYFTDLIGSAELGLMGFTDDARKEEITGVRIKLDQFRERYLAAYHGVANAVATFAEQMQSLGCQKSASVPFLVDW